MEQSYKKPGYKMSPACRITGSYKCRFYAVRRLLALVLMMLYRWPTDARRPNLRPRNTDGGSHIAGRVGRTSDTYTGQFIFHGILASPMVGFKATQPALITTGHLNQVSVVGNVEGHAYHTFLHFKQHQCSFE